MCKNSNRLKKSLNKNSTRLSTKNKINIVLLLFVCCKMAQVYFTQTISFIHFKHTALQRQMLNNVRYYFLQQKQIDVQLMSMNRTIQFTNQWHNRPIMKLEHIQHPPLKNYVINFKMNGVFFFLKTEFVHITEI